MRVVMAGSVIAALSFAATYALAPYAETLGQRLTSTQVSVAPAKASVAATKTSDCRAPFGKVIAALAGERCS